MSPYTLRTFRFPEDYEAVYRLWAQAGPGIQLRVSDSRAEIAKKVAHAPDLFVVAETPTGEIIGAVMAGFDGRRGLIYHLAVAQAYRRQGIGRALMEEIEARLRARGCLRAYLMVVPGHDDVLTFYRNLGWENLPVITLAKNLQPPAEPSEPPNTPMLRFAILTVSDRSARGQREDLSGPALAAAVRARGWEVAHTAILPDDLPTLRDTLARWADSDAYNVILTTGGTGFAPRDVTPEATLAVVERLAPGLAEAMRAASLQITPHAMLSRAVAGIRGTTLIVNLPGSPKAAVENLEVIAPVLPHAVKLLRNDPEAEKGHR